MLYAFIVIIILIMFLFITTLSSRTRIIKLYKKYSKINNAIGLNGAQVAEVLVGKKDIRNLSLAMSKTILSDGYNGKHKTIILSKGVFSDKSIASIAITAHEVGHALQDKQNNRLFAVSQILSKIVRFTNKFVFPLFIIGIVLVALTKLNILTANNIGTYYGLIYLSVTLFIVNFINKLITIPLEYDASKKALSMLREYNLITKSETKQVKKILRTAALTYSASLFDGILIFRKKH